ncbi:MAG: hypothetical protein IJZ85_05650 [Lachnospiraceae bacterium]|nr:hypothetical protein [Lachnospiraceae bacterium]
MRCLEFQQQINDFLDDRLTIGQAGDFMEHADSCHECMEELELRYMIRVGILEQNRDDREMSYDYSQQLNRILERTRKDLRVRYLCRIVKYSVSTMAFWAALALILVQMRVWLIG